MLSWCRTLQNTKYRVSLIRRLNMVLASPVAISLSRHSWILFLCYLYSCASTCTYCHWLDTIPVPHLSVSFFTLTVYLYFFRWGDRWFFLALLLAEWICFVDWLWMIGPITTGMFLWSTSGHHTPNSSLVPLQFNECIRWIIPLLLISVVVVILLEGILLFHRLHWLLLNVSLELSFFVFVFLFLLFDHSVILLPLALASTSHFHLRVCFHTGLVNYSIDCYLISLFL